MRRNHFFICYCIALVSISFTSCYEQSSYPKADNYEARITIHEPVDGDIVNSNNYILLKSTFENNDKIENILVTIVNISTGDTVYYFNKSANADLYYFVNEEIFIDAEAGSQMRMISSTWHHHPENSIADTVYFSVE